MSARGGSKDDLRKVIDQLQKKLMLAESESANRREWIAHEIYKSWCQYTQCQPYKWSDVGERLRHEYRDRADDAVKLFWSNGPS